MMVDGRRTPAAVGGPTATILAISALFGLALLLVTRESTVAAAAGLAGVAAVLGISMARRALRRPETMAIVLAVVVATNLSATIGERGGIGLYLALLSLTAAGTAVAISTGALRVPSSPVLTGAALYLGALALTTLTSQNQGASFALVAETTQQLALLVVLVTILSASGSEASLTRAVVVAVAAMAALTAVQEFALENSTELFGLSRINLETDLGAATARHSGPFEDSNFWGRDLVLFVPLALSLSAVSGLGRQRAAVWLGCAAAMVLGVYLTQSRGAFVALAAAVILWLFFMGGRYRRLVLLLPLAIPLLLLIPGVGSRLGSIDALSAARREAGDLSLVGRVAVQRAAVRMIEDHPLTGVGPATFIESQREYQRTLGTTVFRPLDAHNLYLQVTAESGAIGLVGWMSLYGGAIVAASRSLIISRQLHPAPGITTATSLSAGALAALLAWGLSSVFLHLAHFQVLLLVIAVAAALDVHARRCLHGEPAPGQPK